MEETLRTAMAWSNGVEIMVSNTGRLKLTLRERLNLIDK
jgi:hypothetical protein